MWLTDQQSEWDLRRSFGVKLAFSSFPSPNRRDRRWPGLLWRLFPLSGHHPLLRRAASCAGQRAVYRRYHAAHRTAKDVLLFRSETKDPRHNLLLFRHAHGLCPMDHPRHDRRGDRLRQPVWRLLPCDLKLSTAIAVHRKPTQRAGRSRGTCKDDHPSSSISRSSS